MKKTVIGRTNKGPSKIEYPRKPYGFCCDKKDQDSDFYKSRLSNLYFSSNCQTDGGPDIKFRIQDTSRLPVQRTGTSKIKSAAHLGDCKRCNGPLQWYVEDEIDLARDIIFSEKRRHHEENVEQNIKAAIKKGMKNKQGRTKRDASKGVGKAVE